MIGAAYNLMIAGCGAYIAWFAVINTGILEPTTINALVIGCFVGGICRKALWEN